MMGDHRGIHAPEFQTGAHVHKGRPACWSDRREAKGESVEGYLLGALPGVRNPFFCKGVLCGAAMSRETWFSLLSSTPACLGCARGRLEPLE